VFTEPLLRNRLHSLAVPALLAADDIENSLPYIALMFLKGVFTGRRIETAVLLLLPVFVAVKMFTAIPLLLRNLATTLYQESAFAGTCLPTRCLAMP
jgi:hypothetical protein